MNLNQYIKCGSVDFRHFLSLEGITEENICEIIVTANEMKNMRAVLETSNVLKGNYVLLVTKPNLPRSNMIFQMAIKELAGEPIVTSMNGEQLENCLNDTGYIKSLSECGLSAVMVCTNKDSDSRAFSESISVPVINATARKSPCEALASLMTVANYMPNINSVKITIVDDMSSGDYSLITGFVKLGAEVTLLKTENGMISEEYMRYLSQFSDVKIVKDKATAFKNADFIYLGEGDGKTFIYEDDLKVNEKPFKILGPAKVEVPVAENSIIQGENSLISTQTINLLHVGKAVLALLCGKKR